MDKLWRYTPQSGFTNKNAGFSMWCFGTYEGKEYFIKQFLSPKYPADDKVSSPEKIDRKIKECAAFESRRRELYQTLTMYSDGNDVRIIEFFRIASRYYIVTEKVDALTWTIEDIASMDESEKRRLCAIIAHAIASLHRGGLVHSDIKHDNILYTKLKSGKTTAKIIDFDGGFLENNPPSIEDGVTGDTNYFSPEVCARTYGEDRPLTCKLDVFALGILFHQYFTGKMPEFSLGDCSCPGEAVLRGADLILDRSLPQDIAELLRKMLALNPDDRPSSWDVFNALRPAPVVLSVSASDVADSIVKGRIAYQDDNVPPTHFCTKCGRPISGKATVCPTCAEAFLANSSNTPVQPSPFYHPGDL